MATNNNQDNEGKHSKERTRQEATVLQDFMITTQRRVEKLRTAMVNTATASSSSEEDTFNLSDGEKKILNEIHNSGMMEGIIAGVATFVFVRRFPRYLEKAVARRMQQKHGQGGMPPPSSSSSNGGGYVLDQPGKVQSPFSNSSNASGGMPPPGGGFSSGDPVNRGGIVWRSFGFMVDVTLSFLVAAYTSFYMADTKKIAKSVTEIPLMEGRSAISDQLCPDLIQEYNRQWNLDPNQATTSLAQNNAPFGVKDADNDSSNRKQPLAPFDRKDVLKNPQLPMLQAYIDFIGNCKKRQAMEKRIRRERGMGPKEPVDIPSPGVTSSDAWSDDVGDEAMFGEMSDISTEDATTFVSDQEEDQNNNNGSSGR